MSTLSSVDRSAVTHNKDRASLCSFSFADGRQCRSPRHSGHPHLCYNHARKEAQARAVEGMGRDISTFLAGPYLSACDLSAALGRLFSAAAQGQLKPKNTCALAYLGQTLLQSIPLAEHEFVNTFGRNAWRKIVSGSFTPRPSQAAPKPNATPQQSNPPPHQPITAPLRSSPAKPPQPSPSSHRDPLPPTAGAFVESTLAKLYKNRASDKGCEP